MSREGPYLIREMANDARTILNAAGVAEAYVIGASMGGMIAQELALRFPKSVRRLVLACTSHGGFFSSWPDFSRFPRRANWSRPDQIERALTPLLYSSSTPRHRIEEDLQIRSGCKWCYKGFFGQLTGILPWSLDLRLPRINVPTLVIHGEEDRLVPPQNGKVVASRIPGAQFHLVPNAGHMLLTDQPEISAEIVLTFSREQKTAQPVNPFQLSGLLLSFPSALLRPAAQRRLKIPETPRRRLKRV